MIGVGKCVQEKHQGAVFLIKTKFAADPYLTRIDAVVIQPGQPLKKTNLAEPLTRIKRSRIGVEQRRQRPMLSGKTHGYLSLERMVIAGELINQRSHSKQHNAT